MHTPFASSGMFFFQFVACFLLAVSPFHESLSLVLFRWSLRFLDTRHVAFTYVCMYVYNWSRFLLRRATLLFQISRVFFFLSFFSYKIRLKKEIVAQEANFFEFVRIHCSSSFPRFLSLLEKEARRDWFIAKNETT